MAEEHSKENSPQPGEQRPWQPRFGLGGMLLIMLIFCIMAAAGYYLVQASRGGMSFGAISIVLAMAAPPLLLVLLSLIRLALDTINRRRRPP